MPVYDIAGATRPAQPVTAYYEGKAMRLANRMKEEQLADLPRQRRMEEEAAAREAAEHESKMLDERNARLQGFVTTAHGAGLLEDGAEDLEALNQLSIQVLDSPFNPEALPMVKDMAEALQPEEEAYTLSPGAARYEGDEEIARNPSATTENVGDKERARRIMNNPNASPADKEWARFVMEGKPTVAVNTYEATEEKLRAQAHSERMEDLRASASKAHNNLASYETFEALLDAGAETGTLQPAFVFVKGTLQDLGFDFDETSTLPLQEQISSLQIDSALAKVDQTKGPISDREMALFISAVPGLARSEEGNRLMLEFLRWRDDTAIKAYELAKNANDPDFIFEMDISMPDTLRERIISAGSQTGPTSEPDEDGWVRLKRPDGQDVRVREVPSG